MTCSVVIFGVFSTTLYGNLGGISTGHSSASVVVVVVVVDAVVDCHRSRYRLRRAMVSSGASAWTQCPAPRIVVNM